MLTRDCWWIGAWFDQTCTAFCCFFPLRWKSNKCHECDIQSILQAIPAVQWCNYTQQFSSFQLQSITNQAGKSRKHKGIDVATASPTLCTEQSKAVPAPIHRNPPKCLKPKKYQPSEAWLMIWGLMYTCTLLVPSACLSAWEQPRAKNLPSLQWNSLEWIWWDKGWTSCSHTNRCS